jgi:fumarylacetoacetase
VSDRSSVAATTDPALRSWVPVRAGSDFPIQNLPFGAFRHGHDEPRLCVAIGDAMLDLYAVASAGLLDDVTPDASSVFGAPNLNPLLGAGRDTWRAARVRISQLLSAGDRTLHDAGLTSAIVEREGMALALPFAVADYVDFYSSLEHATNLGKILRPGGEALLPNWRYLPIGYHGRAGTVIPSGIPVVRPRGQLKPADGPPVYAPTRSLDFELELGFVTGNGPARPQPIAPARARDYIFGVALLNDWSARDIQAWEYQPLGPFLAKSFATSLGPWIVTLDALEPFRVAGPLQDPSPLANLTTSEPEGYDIALEVTLASEKMRASEILAQTIARTNFRAMYWSMAQQLAHASSNGASVRAGDLFGSGTISGSAPESYGSMIELTWRGAHPLGLADGSTRAFLEDGDEVMIRGWCEAPGRTRIGFGDVRARIEQAPA